ncbi:MAG TPA: hypothetical protein VMI56_14725 [Reyranella sp.]|nr:hypothetical protein [Reyranella sp.]
MPIDSTKPEDKVAKEKADRALDKALEDSTAGSDPVSFLQPAPVKEGDKELPTVKAGHKEATHRAREKK